MGVQVSPERGVPTVRRVRLTTALEAITRRKLALIVAPGGYGKTTLIQEFAQRMPAVPFCWVHLDPADASLSIFLQQMARAVERHLPPGGLLRLIPERPPQEISGLRHLGRLLAAELGAHLDDRMVVVLDDLHHVAESESVMMLLDALLQHLPPTVHLIIATRFLPSLPLGRLEAQGEVIRLTEEDLCFTREEVERFFAQRLNVTLTPEVRDELMALTEGWVTALVLVANLLHGMEQGEWLAFLRRFPGGGALFDYLAQEVFEQQPAALQQFMLETCVLSELCPAVIERMLEIDCAGRTLQRLEDRGALLIPVMRETVTYRYHHLFQAFLYHRLKARQGEARVQFLHERAARAYESLGNLVEATEHYLRAGQYQRAASLMAQQADGALKALQHDMLKSWLGRIPPPHSDSDPDVLFVRTQLSAWMAQYDALAALYQRCLEQYEARGDFEGLARALSWGTNRYWKLRHRYFYEAPKRWAVHEHPEVRTYGRILAAFSLTAGGRWDEAFARLEALLQEIPPATRAHFDCLELLAVLAFWRADFRLALKYGIPQTSGKTTLGDFSWGIYTWMCYCFLGDPIGLEQYHRQYMAQDVPSAMARLHELVGRLGEGIIHLYHRRWEDALSCLEALQPYFTGNPAGNRTIGSEATFTARMEIAGIYERFGQRDTARELLQQNVNLAEGYPEVAAVAHLAMARFLAEEGDTAAARVHLARAQEADPPGLRGLTTILLELAACRVALAEGNRKAAREALARALALVRERGCPWVLLHHGGASVLPLLMEMAWTPLPGGLPGQVIFEILGALGDQVGEQFSPFLGHPDPTVRGAAFTLLDQLQKGPTLHRAPVLKVYSLGAFRVYRYDQPLEAPEWKRTKVRLLFLILLMRRGKRVSKQALINLLWPDTVPVAARNNLRATMHGLRRSLEPDLGPGEESRYVISDRESVWLDHLEEVWFDLWEFQNLLTRSRELERRGQTEEAIQLVQAACDVNRGVFLPEAALEEYFMEERVRAEQDFLEACLKVAHHWLDSGHPKEAVAFARRALKVDRAEEEAYEVMIQAYLAMGDRQRAMQVYRMCRKQMRLVLGEEPAAHLRHLLQL